MQNYKKKITIFFRSPDLIIKYLQMDIKQSFLLTNNLKIKSTVFIFLSALDGNV